MSLIESILAQTRTDNVISENHDTGSIDWLSGLSDPGEMIACGYMPEARRRAGESDDAYSHRLRTTLTPEQYAELQRVALPSAIRRASLDTSTGKVAVMVAGKAPWHKLGVNVAAAVNSAEASRLASLNWTVSKRELSFDHNGQSVQQSEAYAIVRDDTGACLGIVGSRYAPIQNDEGFAFLDDVLAVYGAKYSTAGAIHGGKKVWMLADLPGSSFAVGQWGDEVRTYAIFTNPHDGSGQAWCYPTTERVVCGNTLRVSTKDRGKGIGIRHTGSVRGKIDSAKAALCASVEGFKAFADNAAALARTRLPDMRTYTDNVLDSVLEVKAVDASKGALRMVSESAAADITPEDFEYCLKTAESKIARRGEILADIIERYESERCNVNGIGGSLWSALNAVTEHADYANGKRHVGSSEAQASRKFESVLAGDADEMKQVAYVQALALVR
jgi:phage/plasmid-like protein (TIGR03299 family)